MAYTFNPTTQAGSSPLTRGKLPEDPHDTCVLGLIPAHAGKTRSVASMSTVRPAHPRSRGENGPLPAEGMELDGSSPLTRGKLGGDELVGVLSRLIPAHAGKTRTTGGKSPPPSAHPRSRGENRDGVLRSMSIGGSSPLTRGKLAHQEIMRM